MLGPNVYTHQARRFFNNGIFQSCLRDLEHHALGIRNTEQGFQDFSGMTITGFFCLSCEERETYQKEIRLRRKSMLIRSLSFNKHQIQPKLKRIPWRFLFSENKTLAGQKNIRESERGRKKVCFIFYCDLQNKFLGISDICIP